jgi:hypothetical protein
MGKERLGKFLSFHGAGRSPLDRKLYQFMDILGATTAVAVLLEAKLGPELTRHHKSCPPRFTDI